MSNDGGTPIDWNQGRAAFVADSDLNKIFVVDKIDKTGGVVDAAGIRSNAGELWGDGIDDLGLFFLRYVPHRSFDNRQAVPSADRQPPAAAALTAAGVAGGGGTFDFIMAGQSDGVLVFIRVVSSGGTPSNNVDVELFRDAARLDQIYLSAAVDPSTQFTDRNPAMLCGDDGSLLESRTVFGRITNNAAGATDLSVEAAIEGVN